MYIMENVRFVDEFFKAKLPKIKVYPPQASFLVWLDCRDLKLSQEDLVKLFQEKAGLLLMMEVCSVPVGKVICD